MLAGRITAIFIESAWKQFKLQFPILDRLALSEAGLASAAIDLICYAGYPACLFGSEKGY